ncbi:MAG TPA: helix-turn-helix domain-containing protein [Solirubrobacterales bacterium]|nr:helix-turn-helix domain-containing protein [Solirubrobacterales bacterium]
MSAGISPIGTAVSDDIQESFEDPEFRAEYERLAPYDALARLVIKRRDELGLTQTELAAQIGTTVATVSRVESGQHAVSARTRQMLVNSLGIDHVERQG